MLKSDNSTGSSYSALTDTGSRGPTVCVSFQGLEGSIVLVNSSDLMRTFEGALCGWNIREVVATNSELTFLDICNLENDYQITIKQKFDIIINSNAVDTVAAFLPELIVSYFEVSPDVVGLQGVAVELNQGLVIVINADFFENQNIAVHLVASGGRLFAEDYVPIDKNNNVRALGVQPLLPLSILDIDNENVSQFTHLRRGQGGEKQFFLKLTDNELAPLGTVVPIRGVVLLEHGVFTRSELDLATEGEILKKIMPKCRSHNISALEKLDQLGAILEGARCLKLRYTTADECVRLIQDEFGFAEDKPVTWFCPPWKDDPMIDQEQIYSESHALIIGNANYTGGWSKLRTPEQDAERVSDELNHRGFKTYIRKNLTGSALHNEVAAFFGQYGRDPLARLFLWFTGHGHNIDGEGFLIPVDAPPPMNEKTFISNALSMRKLGELVKKADAKHILCVINSCTACTIFDPEVNLPNRVNAEKINQQVRQFITAGDNNTYVSGDGRFCRLFLRALRGQEKLETDQNGHITASELGAFLATCVPKITEGAQTPKYGRLAIGEMSGEFLFSLPNIAEQDTSIDCCP